MNAIQETREMIYTGPPMFPPEMLAAQERVLRVMAGYMEREIISGMAMLVTLRPGDREPSIEYGAKDELLHRTQKLAPDVSHALRC